MTLQECREEIKLKLTGGILDCELDDENIDRVIEYSLRELRRYYRSVQLVTLPFERCIDLTKYDVHSVISIFRTDGYMSNNGGTQTYDPIYVGQWQILSGLGNLRNVQGYVYDYAAWNTLMQLRNTTSTDMAFRFDSKDRKLYINTMGYSPQRVTVEYIKELRSVEDIFEDFWIDILIRLAIANIKVTLGRVRSRYTQTNAVWTQDGEIILNEGLQELSDIRQYLLENTQLSYPID